jgi:hypothetical protein
VKERKTTHADAWRGFDRSERVIAYPLAFPVLATHRWVRRGVVMLDRGDVGRFIETSSGGGCLEEGAAAEDKEETSTAISVTAGVDCPRSDATVTLRGWPFGLAVVSALCLVFSSLSFFRRSGRGAATQNSAWRTTT